MQHESGWAIRTWMSVRRVMLVWPAALAAGLACNAMAWQGGPPATPVGVGEVTVESVQNQQLVTGELRAVRRSRVASEEPGVVEDLRVREGQIVEQGEVLVVLDKQRLELELAQFDADLSVAKSVISERQADLEMAQNDLDAIRTIYEQRAANNKELRDAESRQRWATARVTQAERSVEAMQAQRDLIQKRLDDMTIIAPYAGVVVAQHVEVGEWVAEGAAVVDLISIGAIEAWMNVPQSLYASAMDRSLDVTITIDATGATKSTSDKRIVPLVDARARTFTLVATLENEDQLLAPGMSVVGWVPKGAIEERLTVPSDAILRNDAGAYVYAVRDGKDGGSVAVQVRVQVLFPQGWRRVIESDQLEAGDKVVVEGNERLFPMAPVQAMEAAAMSRRDGARGAAE